MGQGGRRRDWFILRSRGCPAEWSPTEELMADVVASAQRLPNGRMLLLEISILSLKVFKLTESHYGE